LRLFIGVALDDHARAAIARQVPPHGPAVPRRPEVRWLPDHNWHLTLQFLGHTDEARTPELREACARAAAACPAFEIELAGTGAFPSPHRARVLWLGVARGHDRLAELAEAVFAQTEPLGFPREQRAFHAHLTLARLKTPADVEPLLAVLHVPQLVLRVAELTLFRSHLSNQGAQYEALATFPLAES
jgi:RNA 2',3'-cyclic 3'-phosphodiesterase